jgi:dTDP-4-amino-4,6-dideoxygalactose transaminase
MVRNKVYDSNTRQFEAMLSKHFDNANVLTVCNATVGIMGVFYALGITNAEVITTPFTWQGAFTGLQWLNCSLKFAKIEEPSLTIAPESIIPLISSNTKAVFTADVLGYPCQLDAIKAICEQHNLLLIHDAASSIGSNYLDNYSGSFADVSIYSFSRNKPFSTSEGGCIVTHSDNIFEKLLHHLAHPERQNIIGNNPNMLTMNTGLNAFAVEYGLAQFEHQLAKIKHHQKEVQAKLKLSQTDTLYFDKVTPNYYKPFGTLDKNSVTHSILPFEPLVSNFGIAQNKFKQYKIYKDLCFPI